jgi:type III restriction enzyme
MQTGTALRNSVNNSSSRIDMQLKEYQQRALDALQAYLRRAVHMHDADGAFYLTTREVFGQGIPYHQVDELPGLPYVCLRIPTGGGKTLVACHAVGIAAKELLHSDHPLALWLTPSNAIRDQTYRALNDRGHPYRQALEAAAGPVSVLSLSDALYLQPATLNAGATIIVSTVQAFRVTDTEGRKVYEASGALMSHFGDLPEALKGGLETVGGKPKTSLANVLYLHRPILIVDEAHNARTPLSFETLRRFNPACILEFTATPDTQDNPSNVLHSVSAAELKAEAMIKMPIRLKVRSAWKELLADAIDTRNRLEAAARLEQQRTGEYLRPIMLLQAQPRSRTRETLTVDVVRQTLLDDFKIPENQIVRATGDVDELGDSDLNTPDCLTRYVITIQALREGWDCPFAYVLCSLVESRSSTAVEQILGRVLRMPKAVRKEHEALNLAYAFSASDNFGEVVQQLEYSLVQNGFERQEVKAMIQQVYPEQPELPLFSQRRPLVEPVEIWLSTPPAMELLPPEIAAKINYDTETRRLTVYAQLDPEEGRMLRDAFVDPQAKYAVEEALPRIVHAEDGVALAPAERGERLAVPQLLVQRGTQLELFEETAFLSVPWRLSRCDFGLSESEYSAQRPAGQELEIDISEKGQLKEQFIEDLQETLRLFSTDQGWTAAELVYWLDRAIYHPDVSWGESNAFLSALVNNLLNERGIPLDRLVLDKYRLRNAVAQKIDLHRKETHKQTYQTYLLPECVTPLVVHPERCFSFPLEAYPYNVLYKGAYRFQKHYYPQVGDLEERGEEFNCAVFLDGLPEVKVWVRNLERRPNHAFWLQTSTDRFYPDFVCLLNDGRYLVVEYKGADRWSNEDSQEKRRIGEVWEKASDGRCLFVMPKGPDFGLIRAKIG